MFLSWVQSVMCDFLVLEVFIHTNSVDFDRIHVI